MKITLGTINQKDFNWVAGTLRYNGEDADSHFYQLNHITIAALKNTETDINLSNLVGCWVTFNTDTFEIKK